MSGCHYLCTSHDWPHVRLVHTHYPVRNAFAGISAPKVVVLLTVHLRDDVKRLFLSVREQFNSFMLTFHLPNLLQYLPQQVQQPTRYLSGLTFRVLPLLAVRQIGLLNIQALRPRTVAPQTVLKVSHQTL